MTLQDLLLVPDHQIDYTALDDGLLEQLATQCEEPFLATSALGELAQRSAVCVADVADAILRRDWDKYLSSYALTLLFDRDAPAAIEHMLRLVDDAAPTVLEAMAENVLNEPARFVDHEPFVRTLVAKLRVVSHAELVDMGVATRLATLLHEDA